MGVIHHILLLVLWDLSFFVHGVVSLCKVTCSTDYSTSLNCSCADAVQTQSVFLHVSCRDHEIEVNDSCEVKPSRSWCVMSPVTFDEVLSVSTECDARATDGDGARLDSSESSGWALCDVVKPEPPSKVQVTKTEDFYNITWDHVNQLDCLTYTVRVREAIDGSTEPVYSLSSDSKHLWLNHERLQPQVRYVVDVKAQMCPSNVYKGPWSEWSSTATTGIATTCPGTDMIWHLSYAIPSVVVLVFLGLLYFCKAKNHCFRYLTKNCQIPKPRPFFDPLYDIYGGNFKEWVNPVFKECDYLMLSSQVQMKNEHDVLLQWNSEKQSLAESSEMKANGPFFHKLQAQDNSVLPCHDGGSQRDCSGHISIHTVTLTEEEGCEEEGMSQNPACVLGSDQDRESFEVFVEDMKEQAAYGLEEAESGLLPVLQRQASHDSTGEDNHVPLHIQFFGAERASLDSLALNEQSEDGYPLVDLDTIDSGFGEYNSPGAEQTQSPHEHINLHSNYVKQWMVCKTVEEE